MLGVKAALLVSLSAILATTSFALAVPAVDPVTMCGGAGWTGPTDCPAGFVCTKLNDYVSLCTRELVTTSYTTRPGVTLPPVPAPTPVPVPPIPFPFPSP